MLKFRITLLSIMALSAILGWSASAPAQATGSQATAAAPGLFCAGHSMSMTEASHSVLVTVQEFIHGKRRNDIALKLRRYHGNRGRAVGYVHPGCWTAIPLNPGPPRPNLCIVVKSPFKVEDNSPKDGKPAACPAPRLVHTSMWTWATYTFKVYIP